MDKYKQFYISSLESERVMGWLFVVIFPLATIALWIFGKPGLWSLKSKIITTLVMAILVYGLGIIKIKESNQELSKLK